MSMTARGGQDDAPAPRSALAKLRFLAIGATLHTKGPRAFAVEVAPHGIIIKATDKALVRVLTCTSLINFEEFDAMPDGAIKARLNQIDAEIDREIAAAA